MIMQVMLWWYGLEGLVNTVEMRPVCRHPSLGNVAWGHPSRPYSGGRNAMFHLGGRNAILPRNEAGPAWGGGWWE